MVAELSIVQDPGRDVRDRIAERSGVAELPDKIWFHKTAAAVIDAGRCVRCGSCVAACPSNSIDVAADGLPTLVRMCTGCSSCWDFCPLAGLNAQAVRRRWWEDETRRAAGFSNGLTPPTHEVGHAADNVGHPANAAQAADELGQPASTARAAYGVERPAIGNGRAEPSAPTAAGAGAVAPGAVLAADEPSARPSAGAGAVALGPVLAAYEARAKRPAAGAQDGGVVTALLAALLERGAIQGALVSRGQSALVAETVLATTADELQQGAGSVYDQSMPLASLAEGLPEGIEAVALVGSGCQITGLRALQRFPWSRRRAPVDRVTLAIGLFCTRSFDGQRLTLELARRGVDIGRMAKVDVREGVFRAFSAEGEVLFESDASDLKRAALAGCDECDDFGAALADIAVGNVGSRPGFTTVLVRTERGARAWEQAQDALEARPLAEVGEVATLAGRNRRRSARVSRRPAAQDGELWTRYSEHIAAYAGTDRAPVAPPPHRSHHYTTAC